MCATCEYDRECRDCVHSTRRRNKCTGLDTSDKKAYNREWMRQYRAQKLREEMELAGVI